MLIANHIPSQPAITAYVKSVDEIKGVKIQAEEITQLYPEILWLADLNVRKTEEGTTSKQASWSQNLFGQKYNEFDRTLMTLFSLNCLLNGSELAYQQFTADQPAESKLTFESFEKMHNQIHLLCTSHPSLTAQEVEQTLKVGLVLGDVGKSELAREVFKPYGASKPDHDDFHEEVMGILSAHPNLCPSFANLPNDAQLLLVKSANLAHYGHINHLEGGCNMFDSFKSSSVVKENDKYAFDFDWLIFVSDVAGALGHVNQNSSLVLNEDCYKVLTLTYEACSSLFEDAVVQSDAYTRCIVKRCEWLGLDSSIAMHRVLAKIAAMLRLSKPIEGKALLKSLELLTDGEKQLISLQLDASDGSLIRRTPTYMPAVLINLLNCCELGETKIERIPQAIKKGLPFIARVLLQHAEYLERQLFGPQNPLNFNPVAGFVKKHPLEIEISDFEIDQDGLVTIK